MATNYIKIVNWETFQHYKDRNPPWIKMYVDVLYKYEFECLQDDSKLLLILLWLFASRHENRIPADERYLKKHLPFNGEIKLQPLIDAGFICMEQNDSTPIAGCKQNAMPETETETETEKEGKKAPARAKGKRKSRAQPPITYDWDMLCFDGVRQEDIAYWQKAYPNVDIQSKLLDLAVWVSSNPERVKGRVNHRAFLTGCISRDNAKHGNSNQQGQQGSTSAAGRKPQAARKNRDYENQQSSIGDSVNVDED